MADAKDKLKEIEAGMCGKNVALLSRKPGPDGKVVEVWTKCLREKGHEEGGCRDLVVSKAPVAQEDRAHDS